MQGLVCWLIHRAFITNGKRMKNGTCQVGCQYGGLGCRVWSGGMTRSATGHGSGGHGIIRLRTCPISFNASRRKEVVRVLLTAMSDIDEPHNCDDPSSCRPSLPRMKSCLKSPSHSGSATPIESDTDDASCKKHVAFCEEGTEQVFQADEWDRTPTEIAQRLSYESVTRLLLFLY